MLVIDEEAAIPFRVSEDLGPNGWAVDADAFLRKPLPLVNLESIVDPLFPRES